MGNILAIDASTKRTGLAAIVDGELKYDVIASASNSTEKRITIMRDGILDYVKKNNIDKIIFEEVRFDLSNARTYQVLTWLQGCVVVALYEYNKNLNVDFIGATTWRSNLGLQKYGVKRDAQKLMDIAYANKTYNLSLTNEQDDEADAICILTAYLKQQEPPKGAW